MRYLPINIDIRGKKAVIVGGGSVAARKCLTLLDAGARVTVIAPILSHTLLGLRGKGLIDHLPREYADGDLGGAFLAFAATDERDVNNAVAGEAKKSGILVDVTDSPDLGTFTSPALVDRDGLLITVSTGGEAPVLAGRIREELDARYGPEYAELTRILGKVREKLLTEKLDNQYNKQIILKLLDRDLPALVKMGDYAEIDTILGDICGPGFDLAQLGIGKKDS